MLDYTVQMFVFSSAFGFGCIPSVFLTLFILLFFYLFFCEFSLKFAQTLILGRSYLELGTQRFSDNFGGCIAPPGRPSAPEFQLCYEGTDFFLPAVLAFSNLDICSQGPLSTPSTVPLISPWNVSFKTADNLSSSDSDMTMCDVDAGPEELVSVAIVYTELTGNGLFFLGSVSHSGEVNSCFLPCETGVARVDSALITFRHPLYCKNFRRGVSFSYFIGILYRY